MQSIREEVLIMTYDQQHLKSFTTHHTPVHVVYLTTSMLEIMTSLSFVFLTLIINIVVTNVP